MSAERTQETLNSPYYVMASNSLARSITLCVGRATAECRQTKMDVRVMNAAQKLTPAVAVQLVLNRLRASRGIRFNHANCNTIRLAVAYCLVLANSNRRRRQADRQEGEK